MALTSTRSVRGNQDFVPLHQAVMFPPPAASLLINGQITQGVGGTVLVPPSMKKEMGKSAAKY